MPFAFFHFFFFFNDTATTEIYTLSLHDALPICLACELRRCPGSAVRHQMVRVPAPAISHLRPGRSEEHTSELQSHVNLVCRLLLEKKKNRSNPHLPRKQKKITPHPQ